MRFLIRVVLAVAVLSCLASADTKVKTRRTMMGHTMEDTVYVKGARQRTEQAGMMGMPATITILQCDQKRIIRFNVCTKTYMVEPLGSEAGGAVTPGAVAAAEAADAGASAKGGVVTIVNSANDTGEKQKMFGLEARHVKSSMSMQPGPGACVKQSMTMERDGWYVNLSPQLSCEMGPQQFGPAMGGGRHGPVCRDTYQMKNTGSARLGFPLKETITFTAEGHPFSTNTEVTELSTANLNPALFEIPQGYRQVNDYMAMMGDPREMMSGGCTASQGIPIEVAGAPAEEKPAAATPATPAPTHASAPPKAAGTLRVGVVKIADKSNELPVVNLRLNLMYEIQTRQMEPIPLENTDPKYALDEARDKDCDYVLFTESGGVAEPGQPAPVIPGRVVKAAVSPDDFHARLDIQLYRLSKPQLPELKTSIPGAAPVRAVDAVMNGFENEAQAVRDQIDKDLHPQKAVPPAKPPAKKPVRKK